MVYTRIRRQSLGTSSLESATGNGMRRKTRRTACLQATTHVAVHVTSHVYARSACCQQPQMRCAIACGFAPNAGQNLWPSLKAHMGPRGPTSPRWPMWAHDGLWATGPYGPHVAHGPSIAHDWTMSPHAARPSDMNLSFSCFSAVPPLRPAKRRNYRRCANQGPCCTKRRLTTTTETKSVLPAPSQAPIRKPSAWPCRSPS